MANENPERDQENHDSGKGRILGMQFMRVEEIAQTMVSDAEKFRTLAHELQEKLNKYLNL